MKAILIENMSADGVTPAVSLSGPGLTQITATNLAGGDPFGAGTLTIQHASIVDGVEQWEDTDVELSATIAHSQGAWLPGGKIRGRLEGAVNPNLTVVAER